MTHNDSQGQVLVTSVSLVRHHAELWTACLRQAAAAASRIAGSGGGGDGGGGGASVETALEAFASREQAMQTVCACSGAD